MDITLFKDRTLFKAAVAAGDLAKTIKLFVPQQLVNMKMFLAGFETTALIFSAMQGRSEMVQYLLTVRGIDVNLIDTTGWSALHWAASIGSQQIVKLLLNVPDIQLEMEDMLGRSAQDLAGLRISCIIQTAVIVNLKKKMEKMAEDVNTEDIVKEIPQYSHYGKRKLNSTLETLEARKKKYMKEVEKIDGAISEAKECIKKSDPATTLQDARNEFECPICFEEMKPPTEIWQCDGGHALCGNCKKQSLTKKCPTCTKDIRGRNRPMENLYRALY